MMFAQLIIQRENDNTKNKQTNKDLINSYRFF